MKKKRYTTPFREFLLKDEQGFYHVRLGPKIYMAKVPLTYIPDFDKEFFGGAQAPKFNWNSILVKDTAESELRPITTNELSETWFKREFRAGVNYRRAKERDARNSQLSRYSANQRLAYHNNNHNKGL